MISNRNPINVGSSRRREPAGFPVRPKPLAGAYGCGRANGERSIDTTARAAFTITEILVVIVIIVLMLAMAMPVFRFITGSRSQAGATNQISAFLGRCRNDAIGLQQIMGVAFYVDSTTGRTALVEVEPVSANASPYTPDTNNSQYYPAYPVGSYVTITPPPSGSVSTTYYYVAIKAVPAQSNPGGNQSAPLPTTGGYWMPAQPYDGSAASSAGTDNTTSTASTTALSKILSQLYDRVPGTDIELLPSGVGVQLAIDDNRAASSGSSNAGQTPTQDRYIRVGAVLFDTSGRLTSAPFIFLRGGPIGQASGFAATVDNIEQNAGTIPGTSTTANPSTAEQPLYSSFGIMVYDRDAWLSQNFPAGDFVTAGPNAPSKYATPSPSELDDEAWLDLNGSPLLINRYTGTLLRNE